MHLPCDTVEFNRHISLCVIQTNSSKDGILLRLRQQINDETLCLNTKMNMCIHTPGADFLLVFLTQPNAVIKNSDAFSFHIRQCQNQRSCLSRTFGLRPFLRKNNAPKIWLIVLIKQVFFQQKFALELRAVVIKFRQLPKNIVHKIHAIRANI